MQKLEAVCVIIYMGAKAVLSGLRNIIVADCTSTLKERRCLIEAYLNMGNAFWEQVKVVADYLFYNFRLAKEIAATHRIDYSHT